jgi:hypothetical protein
MRTDIISTTNKAELQSNANEFVQLSFNHMNSVNSTMLLPEILFVTSFPPRECGIATFSQDLIAALKDQFEHSFNCSICLICLSLIALFLLSISDNDKFICCMLFIVC